MKYLQGNTYELEFKLTKEGKTILPEEVEVIQFLLNNVEKLYPGEVYFSKERDAYIIPLSQEDTFSLEGTVRRQVRVKYPDGRVEGSKVVNDSVFESITERVL